jgi:hypothetical protein
MARVLRKWENRRALDFACWRGEGERTSELLVLKKNSILKTGLICVVT